MKNIWIINHYATAPDEPATRSHDFAKNFTQKDCRVSIFASSFSHYKFIEKQAYNGKKAKFQYSDGVKFVWIKTPSYNRNNWRRFLNMLVFAFRVYKIGKKVGERPDIIIGVSVHPFAALAAYFLSKQKKSRFFLEITDLWPEILIDMKIISKNNPVVFVLKKIEKFLYQKAEKIITLWPFAGDYITKFGVPKEKIVWIPHSVNFKRLKKRLNYIPKKRKLTFLYSGIHSEYAGLDTVLRAVKILQQKKLDGFKIVLIGGGAEKKNLIKTAKDLNLKSVEFRDMVSKDEVYGVMEKSDIFIFVLKNMPLLIKYGISSNKLIDYMAVGRPIIFAVKSKNNPVKDAKAGLTVEPENAQALSKTIKKMASLSFKKRLKMANNARKYAEKYHNIEVLADKLLKLF